MHGVPYPVTMMGFLPSACVFKVFYAGFIGDEFFYCLFYRVIWWNLFAYREERD
jgi:hypothetical protein